MDQILVYFALNGVLIPQSNEIGGVESMRSAPAPVPSVNNGSMPPDAACTVLRSAETSLANPAAYFCRRKFIIAECRSLLRAMSLTAEVAWVKYVVMQ